MQTRIQEIQKKLSGISSELYSLEERKAQLEHMEEILSDELQGYKDIEIKLARQKKKILEGKRREAIEGYCGKDLADSKPQGNE